MKVTFTILLLLATFNFPAKKLSAKQERVLIERRLERSEKEIKALTVLMDKKNIN